MLRKYGRFLEPISEMIRTAPEADQTKRRSAGALQLVAAKQASWRCARLQGAGHESTALVCSMIERHRQSSSRSSHWRSLC